jgi:hypothetical protein
MISGPVFTCASCFDSSFLAIELAVGGFSDVVRVGSKGTATSFLENFDWRLGVVGDLGEFGDLVSFDENLDVGTPNGSLNTSDLFPESTAGWLPG